MSVLAYVPDLMDRSKVAAAAGSARFVARPDDLASAGPDDVVVVDLGRPGVQDVLAAVVATGARVVAFGSHVDRAVLDAARAAGVGDVMARSRFFSGLPGLLAG